MGIPCTKELPEPHENHDLRDHLKDHHGGSHVKGNFSKDNGGGVSRGNGPGKNDNVTGRDGND